jgi:thioredoxin reductase
VTRRLGHGASDADRHRDRRFCRRRAGRSSLHTAEDLQGRGVFYGAATSEASSVPADALFVLIGSQPRTQWLGDSVARDRRGFVLTGPDLPADTGHRRPPGRPPLPLETSLPGVFAAGDVRRGAVNRVASAVGEGAATIPLVHRYLHTTTVAPADPVILSPAGTPATGTQAAAS